jgi:hypothetical protein
MRNRLGSVGVATALALVIGLCGTAGAVPVSYLASSTGQTATADFSFISATQLQIIVTETTPAAAFTGDAAASILTGIGFHLPDAVVIVLPGTVTISAGSSSVGFSFGDLGAGADVSGEWGATIGGEANINSIGMFDFASTNEAQVTQFAGANRDGVAGLDGPQAGLLDDSANRGGLGVIDNSVTMLLTLDADPTTGGNQGLTGAQQAAFLSLSSLAGSVVEYGSNDAFGRPLFVNGVQVTQPGSLVLLGLGLVAVAFVTRRRPRPTTE